MPNSEKNMQKVLIVEDEYVVARDLKMIVEKLGYGVLGIACSGDNAMELLEKSHCTPGLVLMDIALKGQTDGIETARMIQDRCDTQILYITGKRDHSTVQRAVDDTYPMALLSKPFDVIKLKSLVNKALDPGKRFPSGGTIKNCRRSERLPIPSADNATVSLKSNGREFKGTIINLSLTGASIQTPELIMGMNRITLAANPRPGFSEIATEAEIVHMKMVDGKCDYGLEFKPDSEAGTAISEYYSYLRDMWYSSN